MKNRNKKKAIRIIKRKLLKYGRVHVFISLWYEGNRKPVIYKHYTLKSISDKINNAVALKKVIVTTVFTKNINI